MERKEIKIGATYSTLSSAQLLENILANYKIPAAYRCEFWARGLNDTYKVFTKNGNYSLRVYRHGWRTLSEIEFEIEALVFLNNAGAEIAYPIEKREGGYVIPIRAPEGKRYAILTKWVEGSTPDYESPGNAFRYGKSVAKLHNLSSGFQSKYERYKIDLDHLFHDPIRSIKKYISHRETDVKLLENYESMLSKIVSSVSVQELDFGFCHGDIHGHNAHDVNGVITHFDFDCCAYGYRAYELATFKWSAKLWNKESERWPEFLDGYKSERDISEKNLTLIEPYIAIRDIWLLGLHIDNTKDISNGWINDKYINNRMDLLKDVVGGITVSKS